MLSKQAKQLVKRAIGTFIGLTMTLALFCGTLWLVWHALHGLT
jgi:hypothetical protein